MAKQLSQKEKMELIKEKMRAKKEQEKIDDQAYYQKISTGLLWNIFTFFTFFCLLTSILLTIDQYSDGKTTNYPLGSYLYDQGGILIEDEYYAPYYVDLQGFDENSFRVTKSSIFGDPKYLSFDSVHGDTRNDPIRKTFQTFRYNSVYEFFPFIHIFLLIPLIVFIFKKPWAGFNFARLFCFFAVFPLGIYLLGVRIIGMM